MRLVFSLLKYNCHLHILGILTWGNHACIHANARNLEIIVTGFAKTLLAQQ